MVNFHFLKIPLWRIKLCLTLWLQMFFPLHVWNMKSNIFWFNNAFFPTCIPTRIFQNVHCSNFQPKSVKFYIYRLMNFSLKIHQCPSVNIMHQRSKMVSMLSMLLSLLVQCSLCLLCVTFHCVVSVFLILSLMKDSGWTSSSAAVFELLTFTIYLSLLGDGWCLLGPNSEFAQLCFL